MKILISENFRARLLALMSELRFVEAWAEIRKIYPDLTAEECEGVADKILYNL